MADHVATSVREHAATAPARPAPGRATSGFTIAALIPTYNRGGLIERAIDSALGQLRPPDEVIVVDDGSTDDTASRVAAYGDRVRLIRKPQGGVSSARNLGVESSRCDFIAFLDSDDLWEPAHLQRIDRAIQATDGRAVIYFSNLRRTLTAVGDTAWDSYDFRIEGDHELLVDGREWLFRSHQPMLIQASAVKRDTYLAVGGSDLRFPCRGDTHMLFRVGLSGPLCAVAGCAGVQTRDDLTSITTTVGSSPTYLDCTLLLYNDLLETRSFEPAHRRILRRRVAAAHWDYAKHYGLGAPARALASLARATRYDPLLVPGRMVGRLRRRGADVVRRRADVATR